MEPRPLRTLFLGTHNSARGLLAEGLLNHPGGGRFVAYSAGSAPRENQQPNALALRVAGGNDAVALLADTFATVSALCVLIQTFGPVSGAHFTPVVTIVPALRQAAAAVPPRVLVPVFVAAQSLGAASGAWLAHALRTWVPACRSSRPC